MIAVAVIILNSILLVLLSQLYLKKRYKEEVTGDRKEMLRKHWKYILLTIILLIGVLFIQIRYLLVQGMEVLPVTLRWTVILWGIWLLAITDYREKKIPNKVVIVLLLIRIVFLIYEMIANSQFWKLALGQMFLGAIIGGGVLLAAMIISRKGMGMGDVKMFFVIGAYVGSSRILPTLFYAFLVSAIGGIVLLISKKAKMKDTIPMAPFAFAGVMLEYLLLTMGG